MSDIRALLERVEQATGPDRGLDGIIARDVLGWLPYFDLDGDDLLDWPNMAGHWHQPGYLCDNRHAYDEQYPDPPEFTASIDAALALVERMLPGAHLTLTGPFWNVVLWTPNARGEVKSYESAPLAIIAALLRAKAENQE